MKTKHAFFATPNGGTLYLYQWIPDEAPRAIVQVIHGMAEHAARYERLACFLTDRGIAVCADDHWGHGLTVTDGKSWGVLAEKDGFAKMVGNEKDITDKIRKEYPGTPVFLFGHSMGSFISRHYITKYSHLTDGLILSGTGNPSCPELLGGFLIATLQCLIFEKKVPAKFLDNLAFGGYNRRFAPNRTAFDWLSRDEREVDKYIQDPMCGNIFPTGFYLEFFRALLFLKRKKSVRLIPLDLPVCFLSGEEDPVGAFGKGVRKVYETYSRHNIQKLELHLFPGGRHEMLNEINHQEVMVTLYDWIQKNLQN